MGTFILQPTIVESNVGWNPLATTDPLVALVSGSSLLVGPFLTDFPSSNSGLIRANFIGNSLYLDGSGTPIDFYSLSAGFHPLTAILQATIKGFSGSNLNAYLQFTTLLEKTLTLFLPGISTYSYNYNEVSNPIPSIINIWGNGCGVRYTETSMNNTRMNHCNINGTYDILSFSWTVPSSIKKDETFILNATGGVGTQPNLSHINKITIGYLDTSGGTSVLRNHIILSADFIIWTALQITFLFPDLITTDGDPFSGDVQITVTDDGGGTQFTGSVLINSLTVLVTNASGIYTLTSDKRNDTLYTHVGDATEDVAIPTPFIKTGFIGG